MSSAVRGTQQAFIVHGSKDIVVHPINALILAQHLPNAQFVYSDASHGSQYQHRPTFVQHVKLFLSETGFQRLEQNIVRVDQHSRQR